MAIFGNHSNTQVPDPYSSTFQGKNIKDIVDNTFLHNDFMSTVINRGAAIIKARKLSSAMSAAKAIADHISLLHHGTPLNEFTSMGVYTTADTFPNVPEGLIFSLPVYIKNGQWSIAKFQLHESLASKFQATIKELSEEKQEAMMHVQ